MWILPQHYTQIDRFFDIIDLIKTAKNNDLKSIREAVILKLKNSGKYKGRQTDDIMSAANHNIDEPFFYGLIYKINKEIFVSEYGELIYRVWKDYSKRNTVFIFSLFNIQFFNPAKKQCESNLYPFRLFFKVLRDKRIENKLSIPEMYFLYQVDAIDNENDFEVLIEMILKYRKSNLEIKDYFKNIELDFVKSSVSAKYFFTILEKFNILKLNNFYNLKNQIILSPVRRDTTSINMNFFELCGDNISLIDSMLSKYSIFEEIRKSELPSELVSEIYNFVDKDIYSAIGEVYEKDYSLADDIYNYSINPNKCYDFEIKVNEAINMFYNVESEVVSGAGEPDFVARFKPNFPSLDNSKIFTGDTKSTKNQLMGINPGRLKQHMRKYNSDYTILITPKYVPAAKKDILDEKIVILSSLALSETVRNFIKYDDKPSFEEFNEIIINNLGSDISDKFYNKVSDVYGTEYV